MAAGQSPRIVTLWASGRIARFDPSAHVLVISQGLHEMTFTVRGDTKFESGEKPQPPAVVAREVGRDVRINYVTISGARIARRVVIVIVTR